MDPKDPRARNSYDFVRFIAASAVLFSHHFALSQIPEPAVPLYGEDFGKLAVEVFFSLSGFLICRSLQKTTDWAQFVSARFLRIFPNLTFALVTASLATLIWYQNYPHLWLHVKFVLKNLLMFIRGVTYAIPGVFEDNKANAAIDVPLWSLPIELWMYVALFLLFRLGGRRSGLLILAAAVIFSIVWYITPATRGPSIGPLELFQLARLGSFFLSGAILAFCWPYMEKNAVAIGFFALAAVVLLGKHLPDASIFRSLAIATMVVGLGSSRAMAWFSKGGDASYGMYIFAWPIQQFSLLLIDSFWLSMIVAFTATTVFGYATWHGFEKRAMSWRRRFAELMQRSAGAIGGARLVKVEPRSPP